MTEKVSGCWSQPALFLGGQEREETLRNAGKPRLAYRGWVGGRAPGAGGPRWPKIHSPRLERAAARWSLGPGQGCEVTEGPWVLEAQLGQSSSGCPPPLPHPHIVDEPCSWSKEKQHAALGTRERRPWLLRCSFSFLGWQLRKLNTAHYEGAMLKESSSLS